MFSYLIGEVKIIKEDYVVLENNNIGYKIFMPNKDISNLIKNETHKIYTEFIVREDAIMLYGFLDYDNLEMFLSLNQVSGVGPKAALSILSTLSSIELKFAIVGNDVTALSKAQGIGKKTASRIILELTDKIDVDSIVQGEKVIEIKSTNSEDYNIAIDALINLGYSRQDAINSLNNIDITEMNLPDIVKQALKRM